MSIDVKWKYVYWFASLSIFGIFIESLYLFADWSTALFLSAQVLGGFLLSAVSTYIYKKIPWEIHNIIREEPDNTDF